MALSAEAFVDFLEQRGILAPHDIISLRDQVAASKTPLHPTFIARRLVQLRYLNPYFAKTLLEEAIAKHRSTSDESLQLTDDSEDDVAGKAPSRVAFDQPGDERLEREREEEIDLSNITLPVIREVDLMSDKAVERAMLIPALRNRSRIADRLGQSFDIYRLPAWQRVVIAVSVVTTLVLLMIVILLIINA